MHHVHVYGHEISPWKAGGSTLQPEAIHWLSCAEASKIAAFLKAHMQQSCHNSGIFIPAANVLSCRPFDIYLTSKVCKSSVMLFCKHDKTWFCMMYKIKTSLTHNFHWSLLCVLPVFKGCLYFASRIRKSSPAGSQHGVSQSPAEKPDSVIQCF